MLEDLGDLLRSSLPGLTGALGFCVGSLVGYYFRLTEARRVEWNAGVTSLRERLIVARDQPQRVFASRPGDLDAIDHLLWGMKRRVLREGFDAYRQAAEQCEARDALGGVYYSDTGDMSAAADRLLELLKRR